MPSSGELEHFDPPVAWSKKICWIKQNISNPPLKYIFVGHMYIYIYTWLYMYIYNICIYFDSKLWVSSCLYAFRCETNPIVCTFICKFTGDGTGISCFSSSMILRPGFFPNSPLCFASLFVLQSYCPISMDFLSCHFHWHFRTRLRQADKAADATVPARAWNDMKCTGIF